MGCELTLVDMRKVFIGLLCVTCCGVLSWFLRPQLSHAYDKRHLAYYKEQLVTATGDERCRLLYQKLNRWLRAGMTHAEVEQLLGPPDNVDRKYVWVWCYSRPNAATQSGTWKALYSNAVYFLVFDESGHLITYPLVKTAEADPTEAWRGGDVPFDFGARAEDFGHRRRVQQSSPSTAQTSEPGKQAQ